MVTPTSSSGLTGGGLCHHRHSRRTYALSFRASPLRVCAVRSTVTRFKAPSHVRVKMASRPSDVAEMSRSSQTQTRRFRPGLAWQHISRCSICDDGRHAITNIVRNLVVGMGASFRARVEMNNPRVIEALWSGTGFLPSDEMTDDSVGIRGAGWVRTSSWMCRVGVPCQRPRTPRPLHTKGCSSALITGPCAFRGLDCCTKAGPSRTRPHTDLHPQVGLSLQSRPQTAILCAARPRCGAVPEATCLLSERGTSRHLGMGIAHR